MYLIAEIAQTHEGSLGTAQKYIEFVARAGFDAVKFQYHIADQESSREHERFRSGTNFPQDSSRYDYWERTSFTLDQWKFLRDFAGVQGVDFGMTPCSIAAFEQTRELGCDFIKLGSASVLDSVLIDHLVTDIDGHRVILSNGLIDDDDLIHLIDKLYSGKAASIAVLSCLTSYPSDPDSDLFDWIKSFGEKNQIEVGISDHSGRVFPSVLAVSQGASIAEVHVAFSDQCFGPDVSSSICGADVPYYVREVKDAYASFNRKRLNHVDREVIAAAFGKGVYLDADVEAESVIRDDQVVFLKPLKGMTPVSFKAKSWKTKRAMKAGEYLDSSNVE